MNVVRSVSACAETPDDHVTNWLRERARAQAAKAPDPSPERIARIAAHMGWIPAPSAPSAAA